MPETSTLLVQDMAIVIAVGILAQVIAERARMPAIVLLLMFGVLVGPDVLGWVEPAAMGFGLEAIVSLAVALILFEGGLQLHLVDVAAVGRVVRNLVTVGAAVTVAGSALAGHYLAGLDWAPALLFGAIVSVTGPTVINPLLDRVHVRRKIDTILRGEGILIDPVGAILAVIVLEFVLTAEPSIWHGLLGFMERILVGGAIGLAGGWLLSRILRFPRAVSDELANLLVLGWVLALFSLSQTVSPESGILAVVVAGMAVRRESIPQERLVRRFKSQLSVLFISILFILLSAYLPLATIARVGWMGVLAVVVIMLVVRPLNILVSTVGSDLGWRERVFLSWICPRGVVAISIASFIAFLFAGQSEEVVAAGLTPADGEALLALVFLTIAITVLVQGSTARPVARLLGVLAMEVPRVIVIGANRFGLALGEVLHAAGLEPVFVDTNGAHVARVRDQGFVGVVGNCLERRVLESAGVDGARALVATTSNQEINLLAAQRAKEEYHVPAVFPVLVETGRGAHAEMVDEIGGDVAFGRQVDIPQWNYDLGRGIAHVEERVVPEGVRVGTMAEYAFPDGVLPLVMVRSGRAEVVHSQATWSAGDLVVFLVREGREEALDVFLEHEQKIAGVDRVSSPEQTE